uniref:non-specific serine/threonine protein kinase n=1 Tax=Quercus lobata TaxID=97700 RepID=A0A7N2N296_QUELO
MASLLFFLLLAISTTEAQQGESNVNLGSFLTPTTNSSWLSRSGLYAFGFYQQANGYAVGVFLAGISEKTVVWTANRDNPPVLADATLNFTTDGRLILQSAQGKETNIASPSDSATSASMLDSGNFVIYNSNKEIIWQSFDNPTNTLLQGQRLRAGNELVSSVSESDQSAGIFRLEMQTDGRLVQYPVRTPNTAEYSYWASGTGGQDTIYLMRIDADGIFRLYSHNLDKNGNFSVIWSSSYDKCDPKGLCGLNGFCTINDQDADCLCLPGFTSVNQEIVFGHIKGFLIVGNVGTGMDVSPRSFTYSDLEKMTNGFKEELGRGSSGTVYKGTIWNGQKIVAVKRLKKVLREGEKEFQTEMKVIGRTHHKNLVRLLGYCHDGENKLLVYEYMSNGSLADILFKPEKQLCWNERVEIARSIAKGILYLHEELTIKADVYSFGIVLLELICYRKSVDWDLPEEEAILEEWAYYCFEACELSKLVSDKDVDKKQLERMVKVGLWCVLDEPSLRPSIKKVLLMLEGTVDIPIPPSPTSLLSTI